MPHAVHTPLASLAAAPAQGAPRRAETGIVVVAETGVATRLTAVTTVSRASTASPRPTVKQGVPAGEAGEDTAEVIGLAVGAATGA